MTTYPQVDTIDAVWGTDDHLWGPDVRALGLDHVMEDVELGGRVSWWITMCLPIYSRKADRCQAMTRVMVGEVSSGTYHRGLPFPPEWWPLGAGEPPA